LDYANDGLHVIYITDSGASNYSDMKTSNSGVGKYCVQKNDIIDSSASK
jgi:hypothetical protein